MSTKRLIFAFLAVISLVAALILNDLFRNSDSRARYEEKLLAEFRKLPMEDFTEVKGEKAPDRPDLAAVQNYFTTMDPALGRVPSGRLVKAWEQMQTMQHMKETGGNNLFWTSGGANMGGRTRAVMYDPNDPEGNKVWAGAVTGGLWYNEDITDDMSSWIPLGDFWSNLSVSCMISDPNDSQVFYLGTGEAETARIIYRESSGIGIGIMKSSDGGQSWELLPSTSSFQFITDIAIRDEDGVSVIYAGVASGFYKGTTHQSEPSDGLFRSTDGGLNWEQVLPDMPGFEQPYAVSNILIQGNGRIFVGSMETPGLEGGGTILWSDDGTIDTWTAYEDVKTMIENQVYENIPGRVILAGSLSDPAIVYALFSVGYDDGFVYYKGRYIFKTTDAGLNWQAVNLPDQNYATLSWHALTAAVNPVDPEHVWVGGLDVWSSFNAGNSWIHQSDWSLMYWGGGDDYVHADQHLQLYKEGSVDEMLFGTDGGVFYTANASSTNPVFEEKNKGYNSLQFYTCAISPIAGDDRYIGGLQDNGTLYYQGSPLDINDMIDGGDGAGCFWDVDEPEIFITSYYYNRYTVFVNGSPYQSAGQYSGTFICPADYDYKTNRLYANACSFFGYRADQLLRVSGLPNASYEAFIAMGTGSTTPFTHVKYSPHSPQNTSTLFIGGQSGRLFRVANAQAAPQVFEITGTDFPMAAISCVAIGGSEDTLLVTFSNYGVSSVWQTYDGGESWMEVQGNLPDMPVRYALYHPDDAKQAMLATELGIWTCNHMHLENPQWEPDIDGMANVRVDMLQLREADLTVLAATHGRGLFTATWTSNPWVSVNEMTLAETISVWPNPFGNYINVSLNRETPGSSLHVSISDINGKTIIRREMDSQTKSMKINTGNLASGVYMLRIDNGNTVAVKKIIKE